MKGKIVRIENEQIIVRPNENFLDVIVDRSQYPHSNLYVEKEVEITFVGALLVIINGLKLYGKFEEES